MLGEDDYDENKEIKGRLVPTLAEIIVPVSFQEKSVAGHNLRRKRMRWERDAFELRVEIVLTLDQFPSNSSAGQEMSWNIILVNR